MLIPVPPSNTGNRFNIAIRDTTGATMTGMGTANGITCVSHFESSNTWVTLTLSAGTLGTFATNTIVNWGTTSTTAPLYQFCPADTSIPTAFNQKVTLYLANGTVGSQTMFPIPLTLVGSDANTSGQVTPLPSTFPTNFSALNITTTGQILLNPTQSNITAGTWMNVGTTQTVAGTVLLAGTQNNITAGTWMNVGTVNTTTNVTNTVGVNWASISNASASNSFTNTRIANVTNVDTTNTVTTAVAINWALISNPSASNLFTGSRIANVTSVDTTNTVTTAVALNWALIINQSANNNFTNTTINSVTVLPTINDTNSSAALLILKNATAGTASFATNQALIVNPSASANLSGTSIASVTGGIGGTTSAPTTAQIISSLTTSALLTTTEISADQAWLYLQLMTTGSIPSFTASALINAPTGGGGFNGSRQVTLNFEDANSAPVGNVVFTVVGTGTTAVDGTGSIVVGLNDGTYTVVPSPTDGTIWSPTDILVSSTSTTFTFTGTFIVVPTPSSGQCTGTILCVDPHGAIEPGVVITFRAVADPNSGDGVSVDSTLFYGTSNGAGIVSALFTSGGWFYEAKRGDGDWIEFETPAADGSTFDVKYLIGSP